MKTSFSAADHDRGATVKITDYTALALIRDMVNGDIELPNKLTYENTETIDDAKDLATKAYVDGLDTANVKITGAQTVTGKKTFDTTKIGVKGSSTGVNTIANANAGATDYTNTIPAKAGTFAMTIDIPVKATGAEINTGTDDAKFTTAKAIEDSGLAKTSEIPVKATGAEINTATDDAKFATAKAIEDSNLARTTDIPVKATGAEINTGTDDAKFATAKAIEDSNLAKTSDIPTVASSSDINTGTDNAKFVSADAIAGANIGKRIMTVKVFADDTAVTTGNGKVIMVIPLELNGMNLTQAEAMVSTVSSSGLPTIQIRNVTDSVDMLSTRITIDATEYTSYDATARSAVDGTHDDVATGDRIAIDVDVAGTGAKGLEIILTFNLA